MRSIGKETPQSRAHLYVALAPSWPHFWCAHKSNLLSHWSLDQPLLLGFGFVHL